MHAPAAVHTRGNAKPVCAGEARRAGSEPSQSSRFHHHLKSEALTIFLAGALTILGASRAILRFGYSIRAAAIWRPLLPRQGRPSLGRYPSEQRKRRNGPLEPPWNIAGCGLPLILAALPYSAACGSARGSMMRCDYQSFRLPDSAAVRLLTSDHQARPHQ